MNRSVSVGLTIALLCLVIACSSTLLLGRPGSNGSAAPPVPETIASPGTVPPENGSLAPEAAEDSPPAELIEDLKSVVSSKTGIPSHEVLFVSAEAVDWPDACLGVSTEDEVCAQVITPGYRIALTTLTQEYVFHTDRSGREFRFAHEGEAEE
ncbi:hypothetical protein [Egbenema bharatensis]|uniref:hypothetical protein n=1 Tax=Egbenema bharatensis TaxID=3463334 RepID=UPI003A8C14A9